MKRATFYIGTFLLIPAMSSASISAYISSRESNSLGIHGDWTTDSAVINRQDCMDDIEFTITIDISNEDTEGRQLYVFAGDNCDDSEDSSDCDDDVIELDADDTSVTLPVSFILSTDDCEADDSTSVWVGLLESEDSKDETDDNAVWASPIDFNFDGSFPDAPDGVSVSLGENNLYVAWDETDDDEDLSSFLVVYALADESVDNASDAGADAGTTEETCFGLLVEGASLSASMSWKEISSGASTSGRVTDLANDVTYQVAVVAIDEYGNPSPLSEVVCKAPGETVDFFELYALDGGKSGDYCFIATAAFHDIDHPVVRILRRFRDDVLMESPLGRLFVAAYYRVGPTLARYVENETVAAILRVELTALSGLTIVVMEFHSTFVRIFKKWR